MPPRGCQFSLDFMEYLVGGGGCVLGGIVMASSLSLNSGLFQVGVGLAVLGVIAQYVAYRLGQDVNWRF